MTADMVRAFLTGESPRFDHQRSIFRHIPSSPRCKLCAAPFRGLGSVLLKPAGYGRFAGNPALVWDVLRDGKERAQVIARQTILEVKQAIGLPV